MAEYKKQAQTAPKLYKTKSQIFRTVFDEEYLGLLKEIIDTLAAHDDVAIFLI